MIPATHILVRPFLALFARYPIAGGVFGLVTSLAFGYLGIASWQELQNTPQGSARLSLAEAVAAEPAIQDPPAYQEDILG